MEIKCSVCGVAHPEYQLESRVKKAQRWYEETGEKTVVFKDECGYDFTTQDDKTLSKYIQVLRIPQGFVQ